MYTMEVAGDNAMVTEYRTGHAWYGIKNITFTSPQLCGATGRLNGDWPSL